MSVPPEFQGLTKHWWGREYGFMVPYVVPFILYLGLTQIPTQFPKHYPWLYSAVVLVVGIVTCVLLYRRGILRPHLRVIPGLVTGLVAIGLWIGICHLQWDQHIFALLPAWLRPEPRPGYNPFFAIANPAARWGFILMRMVGLALLVPVAEELFWRGFLARWLLSPDWQSQPIGRFTPYTFAGVTILFMLAHPEWLAAAVYCALLNFLLIWTRDLWNCVVAHGVSNLVMGIYILSTGTWDLW